MELLLVILDLNGTLMDSSHRMIRGAPAHDFKARYKYVYYRPGMSEFLSYLANEPRVRLAVWTSCARDNARAVVDRVFYGVPLEFCFSREECDELPGPGYRTVKDLRRVWDRFPRWNSKNTVILDDSEEKLALQPDNLIRVPRYEAGSRDGGVLGDLRERVELLLNRVEVGEAVDPEGFWTDGQYL